MRALTLRQFATVRRAATTDRGMAWAIWSSAVASCWMEPDCDDRAAVARTAFGHYFRFLKGRWPEAAEMETAELMIGRPFPPVLSATQIGAIGRTLAGIGQVICEQDLDL